MKINYLKINNFGKINNKEINLENNINLIYGKNESGKSTLLKFITSMLYGISKNKNGKDIADSEKYKPWNQEDFSGKIIYQLDDENKYEVFRDFNKKSINIYNEKLENISKKYNIDKTKGNQFFYDQTKIDEDLFLSTTIVEQQNVTLDKDSQNILTQKIANILSSGNDNISYKKVIGNLSKKLTEQVGTERTIGRPLNNILNEIKETENEIKTLEEYNYKNINIKNQKEIIENKIKELNNQIKLIKEIKKLKEKENIEKEKININNNIKKEYDEKIKELKNKININNENNQNNKEINKKNKLKIINLIFVFILIIFNVFINIINVQKTLENILIIFTAIYLIINLIVFILNKNKLNKNKHQLNNDIEKIKKEIEILEENKNNKEKEIELINFNLLEQNKNNLESIKNEFINQINITEIMDMFNKELLEINKQSDLIENELSNKRIELNTTEIEEENIKQKLENYSNYKERLNYLYKEKEELLSLEKSINLAKESLENAYNKMKNEVTPKFTKDLSTLVERISDGKYKKVNFNSDEGLKVELDNGNYVDTKYLSIGTIDQLYLSLRLSSMQEITEEKMPIILDEAFAYYDDERLENILKYINENYKNNQIIIFTCSKREKGIMDKLNMQYNFLEI